MKKIFKIENIDCANCAAKIEDGIKKISGVESCSLSFFAEKLIIEADDDKFDTIMKEALKVARKVEPDCEIS
ncbi:MAG: cation transporter [Clostridia bacterium]|nr:cation transporter [Clostridia bacterium]